MNAARCMKADLDIRKIAIGSIMVDKKPGNTKHCERGTVAEEPPSAAEILRCRNFMAWLRLPLRRPVGGLVAAL